MRVINFSDARTQFKQVIDRVVADQDVAIISRRDAEDEGIVDCGLWIEEAASSKGSAGVPPAVSRILRENYSGVFTIRHLKR